MYSRHEQRTKTARRGHKLRGQYKIKRRHRDQVTERQRDKKKESRKKSKLKHSSKTPTINLEECNFEEWVTFVRNTATFLAEQHIYKRGGAHQTFNVYSWWIGMAKNPTAMTIRNHRWFRSCGCRCSKKRDLKT